MSRWEKTLLIALPTALLLSAACRFIHHTDREYSYWIALYGESMAWLEERCAELSTPGVCGTAQDRRSFLISLESYRDSVKAWWWPTLVLTALAWVAVLASLVSIAWQFVSRRNRV
jgi:hypothetical protein